MVKRKVHARAFFQAYSVCLFTGKTVRKSRPSHFEFELDVKLPKLQL